MPKDAASPVPAPARAQAAHGGRLGFGLLSLYGSGAMTEVVMSFALGQFLLFYLTIVCGLPGTLAGVVGLLSLTLDAFVDPLVGSLSDNLRSPLGRRHPFMIGASIPIAITLVLLFAIPAKLTGVGLFAYATALCLLLRVAMSVFQVPFLALGAELSDDYQERSTIVAFRVAFGVVGTIIATVLSYGLFLAAPGAMTHKGPYVLVAASFAAGDRALSVTV